MSGIGIVNLNQGQKNFPKVVEQAPAVESGMYKAIFYRFVTLGFSEDAFNEGQLKFKTVYGFELVEDMMGNKVPNHWKKFDDGTQEEGAKCLYREYPVTDSLHHKSGGFSIAKALDPQVQTVRKGKNNEHEYIINFPWEQQLGKSVLLQVQKKKAKETGREYNQIQSVMPLGMPLQGANEVVYFNLYDSTHKEIFDEKLFGWEKKRVKESTVVPGEPDVIYREEAPAEQAPQEEHKVDIPPVDFDDSIPF